MHFSATKQVRVSACILGATAIVVLALIASRADFIPLWDGRGYAECIMDAASNNFRPYFLRCFGHSSHAYVIVAGLAYKLAPGSHIPILIVDSLLFAAACVAFHRLVRLTLPDPALAIDRAAVTAAFALQPSFLAMVVQPNLDLPVLAGFLWCLVTLIERRWVWTVLVGLAIVFSKETGALLYGLALACYTAWQFARDNRPFGDRARAVLRLTPLAIPLVVYGAYLVAFLVWRPTSNPLWIGTPRDGEIVRQFIVPRFDRVTAGYALMIFVLNFAWIPTVVVLADVAGALRARVRGSARAASGTDRSVVALCAVMCVVVVYFITRFATFTTTRYVAVGVAMLLLMFGIAVVRLGLPTRVRYAVLGVYVALLVPSVLRTIDPVSRLAFGTFSIGSHRLLSMTSLTRECCGPNGMDQLAYSLEFTTMEDLVDQALVSLKEIDSLTIIVPESGDWHTIGPTDSATGGRTLSREGVRRPVVTGDRSVASGLVPPPATAWYFALPNFDASGLRKLAASYTIGAAREFERDGYRMAIYPLARR